MNTILVVDDSELVNTLLCDSLESHGYDVLQAHDANEAYQIVRKQPPDLILLDIVLPDVNGVELCKAFRSAPATRHIPIILVTGTASSTREKVKGLQAGADDYILKPFEMDELLERVRTVLRRAESRPVTALIPTSELARSPATALAQEQNAPALTLGAAITRAFFSPGSLPQNLPRVSLLFILAMTIFVTAGLWAAPGTALKPIMACLLGGLLWGFLVSVVVVSCSLAGIELTWKEGARLFSFAALPLLFKLAGAAVFSAWTTLSPFYFSASPLLFFPRLTPWFFRMDAYEIWAVVLLAVFLRKRPGASVVKVALVTLCVWILALCAAAGLMHMGGAS